jgi:hypothetical protein
VPSDYRGDGDTLRTVAEAKEYSRSRDELEMPVANAIGAALGRSLIEEPLYHWHGPVTLFEVAFR